MRWLVPFLTMISLWAASAASAVQTMGVWLYHFPTTSFDNTALVSRLNDMLINQVNLSMGTAAQHRALDPGQATYDASYVARLADFISKAHAAGISVHAMTLDDPGFTLTSYHALARSLVGHILVYNANHASAAFDGINSVVEPWSPVVWTGCCDLVTGENYAQLDGLLAEYRTLLGELRSDIDAHETATGQHLIFSATTAFWMNDEATIPGRLPNGDASVYAADLDVLVPLVYGGIGSNAAEVIAGANDEILEVPTMVGISSTNLSYQDRAITITVLNNLYAASANYRGTVTFEFMSLESQYLSQ